MPLILVISSFVAGSRVGGGLAPFVLAPMKVDPVHVPTCLFGRHPGWGPPGGGPVAAETMTKMLEGVEANGLFSLVDAVVTGHFSTPDQVVVAADAIARIRAAPRGKAHEHAAAKPLIIVDPVMGDEGPGLYIRPETAAALTRDLVPHADLVAPNLWEFARLAGVDVASLTSAEDVAAAAKRAGGSWLISSSPSPAGLGVVLATADGAHVAETPLNLGAVPNGTGDLLTLRFAGGLVSGLDPQRALSEAVGATVGVIDKTVEWRGSELCVAACQSLLTTPPLAPVRRIS